MKIVLLILLGVTFFTIILLLGYVWVYLPLIIGKSITDDNNPDINLLDSSRFKKVPIDLTKYDIMSISDLSIGSVPDLDDVMFLPYMSISIEGLNTNRDEYNKFINEYDKLHKRCPICGSTEHITTLMGYILNMENKEAYQDKNLCTCNSCGDKHTMHDRKPF